MALPAVLLVLVLSPPPPTSAAAGFEAAARRLLDAELDLRVEMQQGMPSDEAAVEQARGAMGLVKLGWDRAHRRVSLHCYVQESRQWIDRMISFEPTDRLSEQGRLVGFAVASMYARGCGIDAAPLQGASAPAQVDQPSSAASTTAVSVGEAGAWGKQRRAPSGKVQTLEFAGIAANGIGGSGAGMGASIAALLELSEALMGRLVLSARLGDVPAAQATTRTILAGTGLVWSVLPSHGAIDLRLRVDALCGWLQVSHFSEDDVIPAHEHRWLAGGDAVVTIGYSVSQLATLYLGSGIEALLGPTALYTHGRRVGTVPVLRAVAEVGVRTNF